MITKQSHFLCPVGMPIIPLRHYQGFAVRQSSLADSVTLDTLYLGHPPKADLHCSTSAQSGKYKSSNIVAGHGQAIF
jgi:hypothetical protein